MHTQCSSFQGSKPGSAFSLNSPHQCQDLLISLAECTPGALQESTAPRYKALAEAKAAASGTEATPAGLQPVSSFQADTVPPTLSALAGVPASQVSCTRPVCHMQ